ncbi:M16 family metallopeptidase [Pseudozobellia thermophila]|uniref:Predicted Zn-dependent peptidase n=1 Tax=Pseudozobellia thermophila TaxID=192903 RepID=A0A1M6AM49_9FLAO|nr:pitrilysin family protein [Pseudozobellia thermophila]SHI37511.1 Predicted Zn-dependent peptidase [Pseudozobellia thermophila]
MKKIFTSIFIVLFIFCGQAQIDRSKMPEPGPAPEIKLNNPKTFAIQNGLKVLVVENHKLPRVSIQLEIDNPPILEGDKAGVSNLMASLLGKGSKNIPKDEFNEEVDFLGARINFGAQSAFASSLSQYFPRILELMADAAINPNFTHEEFEKEKQKLLTGLKADEKNVPAISRRVSMALAYTKNHPYGEFMTEESVNKVSLTDIIQFYETYFVPANAYLVVVGDVEFEQVKALVEEHFISWTKAAPLSFTFSRPSDALYTQINFVDMPNAVQSEIMVENLVDLKKNDPDYLAAVMANEILGGGGEGRLFLNLREDKGYTYGSYSGMGYDKHAPSRFIATASVRNAVTDSAVVEILKEIDRIRTAPVTPSELENTKAKYTGRFVMALENPTTIANYALNIETENLPKDFYQTYLEKLNAITIEEVQKAAQKYLKPENLRIVVTGKGSEILENLEKLSFKGKKIPVNYFDKYANKVEKPDYNSPLPANLGANDVLHKYIEAIGGEANVKAITSYTMRAQAEMQGTKLDLEMIKTAKNQFRQDIKVAGNSMSLQVFDGEKGYVVAQGQRNEMGDADIAKIKQEAAPFPELGYLDSEVSIEGLETIADKKAYKLKISDNKWSYYDVDSGLKVQETNTTEMAGQIITSTITYSDYKEVGGVKFPFMLAQTVGPQSFEFKVSDIKVNEGVSDADFE